jgi:NAD(P)H dehydrogenase (quinone)
MSKVLILYDTRTGNTGQMARAVAEGAKSVKGAEVVLKRIGESSGELADADMGTKGRAIWEAPRSSSLKTGTR